MGFQKFTGASSTLLRLLFVGLQQKNGGGGFTTFQKLRMLRQIINCGVFFGVIGSYFVFDKAIRELLKKTSMCHHVFGVNNHCVAAMDRGEGLSVQSTVAQFWGSSSAGTLSCVLLFVATPGCRVSYLGYINISSLVGFRVVLGNLNWSHGFVDHLLGFGWPCGFKVTSSVFDDAVSGHIYLDDAFGGLRGYTLRRESPL